MKVFNKIAGGLVLSLNVLLIFFLIFQERLSLPAWLQSVGRMHPLLLHLPIGIVIVVLLLSLFRSEVKPKSFDKVMGWLLTLSALTTVTAALMGLVLSREGGYDDTQLNYHLISGSAFSFMAWLLMLIGPEQKGSFQLLAVANVILVILAGHFGSVLTHGENFVWAPLMKTPGPALLTDSTSLYQAAIEPVLRSKCFSCHNEQKKKGKLLMTSVAAIARGGKHGPIWVSGDPERSSLIQRINLPEDHEEHMPPSGKTPLTEKEKQLLFQWIARGANTSQAWTRYAKSDSLFLLAKEFIHTTPNTNTQPVYNFTAASEETIKKLNTPYRTVTPLAAESPALAAEFFLSQAFDYKQLSELTTIKEQLVDLSLAGMPVTDAEGKSLAEFTNLEKLNLNKTKVSGKIVSDLKKLKKLRSLSVAGTSVNAASLEEITSLPELKEIFVWNTAVTQSEFQSLEKKYPNIRWDFGYQSNETLRLTPPILLNDSLLIKEGQFIRLKHNLPGTIIRYTLDGSKPDTLTSPEYKGPIPIDRYTRMNTIACREGWWASQSVEFIFFKSGHKPSSVELLTAPEKDYPGEGGKTLTDFTKGNVDILKTGNVWLGFRYKPFEALFTFEKNPGIREVTVSYGENVYAYLVPPESIELWAGKTKDRLQLVSKVVPAQPTKAGATQVKGIVFSVAGKDFTCFKLIARPVAKLPEFISKKREKGWFFVDEVLFN